jgi:benzoyl-CoA reductase subunit C
MKAFETLQRYYQQRDLAAREYKKKGGRVVGYLCDYVPDELILAAGFFPLRLSGAPAANENNPESGSAEGFVSTTLNMLLAGKYDFLDYLVIPHARDSVYQMYSILKNIKASDAGNKLPELFFLDHLHPVFLMNQEYNRDRMVEFKKQLEKWSGKRIAKESLTRAIGIGNENKALLKKMAGLRMAETPRISGVEALQIIGSSMFMLKEENSRLLRDYLGESGKLTARKGTKLFVSGSPTDNLQFYEVVESCDATIIAEDNCWGNRSFDVPVDTFSDPFEAIVDRYQIKPPCPHDLPLSRRITYCVEKAKEAKAEGVIVNVLELDNIQTWEVPKKIAALEQKGIPSLHLKRLPYFISDPEPLQTSVKEFMRKVGRK